MDNSQKIAEMLQKIAQLTNNLSQIQRELNTLKTAVLILREQQYTAQTQPFSDEKNTLSIVDTVPTLTQKNTETPQPIKENNPVHTIATTRPKATPRPPQYASSDIEKFIGENLSNKVGMLVMVLGIAIGVKYAIDKDLISPLMRILLGYLLGFGLVGVSVKLREKYTDLSAVILGGALASLYFVTFAAYDFYSLIPQILAFLMMLVITIFAVVAALSYTLQVIAIAGLVGAYFIPFLLSNNSGRADILFSYILLVNMGILYIGLKKDWKLTNYLAFLLTWLIYFSWILGSYDNNQFTLGFIFAILFFSLFYILFLAYKFINDQPFTITSVSILLMNTTIFYGVGYGLLSAHQVGKDFLGLFTLCNAIIHFGVSLVIYRRELADRNLFFLVSGLVLTFITLTIPVQFSGHWIAKFWAFEMALLFWIGRTRQVTAYEVLSYPLIVLNIMGIIHNTQYYNANTIERPIFPFWNEYFWTFVILWIMFYIVFAINKNEKYELPKKYALFSRNSLYGLAGATLIALTYICFLYEFDAYFTNWYNHTFVVIKAEYSSYNIHNDNIYSFRSVWLLYYSIFFAICLSVFNIKQIKNKDLSQTTLIFSTILLLAFLTLGLYTLGYLKNSYLYPPQYFQLSVHVLYLRYIGFVLLGSLFYSVFENIKLFFSENKTLQSIVEIILSITTLWCIASEMVNWLEITHYNKAYKTVLSILFGSYALFLIILGIRKEKRHLRILGMLLFGVTLVKLFFYDLTNLETIAKTIIMIVLGGLLLVVSFIYNKIKNKNEENTNL
jgi:uncharacterized membrane protein